MSYSSRIIGTGSSFPDNVVTNTDLEKFLDTSDEWIRSRTGITERRIASPGETTLTFAQRAAEKAIQMADLRPSDIDFIVVGSVTPDTVMPCVANQIQAGIGAKNAFSFDLQAACSGWAYGLSIADSFIKSGAIRTAVVIGAETLSTIVDWRDRGTAVLFGDGAGATVLRRSEDPGHQIIGTKLYSDGANGEILCLPHGFSKVPPWSAEYRLDMHKIRMKGAEIFKFAVRNMVDAAQQILKEHQVEASEVDFFIFHQANMRIVEMCAKALNVDRNKMWNNLDKYGNTSAATLPVCLDEAWRAGAVKPGNLILMVTFGGGLTWAAVLVRL